MSILNRASNDPYPGSRYIKKVEIDFGDLPNYVVQRGIIWLFEDKHFYNDDEYISWQIGWADFLKTIPEQHILNAVEKGIEYAKKVYEVHLRTECKSPQSCVLNESWERRIALAGRFLAEIKTANNIAEPDEPITQYDSEAAKPFTTARQVLAIHYLLNKCDIRNVDNTAKARFIQFLTGKEAGAKDIKNTTIYKRVSKPFNLTDKALIADLQFIRHHFEKLGLFDIVAEINDEINKSQ